MVGEILNGRYEILKSVGFGGMAEVYLAKDVLLDRKIAIKVLRKKFLDSKTQLEQFKREARSAARLIHPSIVTIYDVCDEGDISYILMEYVEGVSLKSFEEQNERTYGPCAGRCADGAAGFGAGSCSQAQHYPLRY